MLLDVFIAAFSSGAARPQAEATGLRVYPDQLAPWLTARWGQGSLLQNPAGLSGSASASWRGHAKRGTHARSGRTAMP